MKKLLTFLLLLLPAGLWAQDSYYYHTVRSSSLAATFGRTVKAHYAYQLSHLRQLKFSGIYVADEYTTSDGNRVKTDAYNAALQFQYNLLHRNKFFLNANLGGGINLLNAKDLIGVKFDQTTVSFLAGAQIEYYLQRNRLALVVDYDLLYLPFSDLYNFLHVPTAGLSVFF